MERRGGKKESRGKEGRGGKWGGGGGRRNNRRKEEATTKKQKHTTTQTGVRSSLLVDLCLKPFGYGFYRLFCIENLDSFFLHHGCQFRYYFW